MYKAIRAFQKPDDENIKIWRYLDFTKFVSMLDKQALFFVRSDRLSDKFEGSNSKANVKKASIPRGTNLGKIERAPNFAFFRRFMLINSWHMNEYESAAMWNLYLKTEEGVAIQSTFKWLTKSFNRAIEDSVYVGVVKYIDYEKDWLPQGNVFYPFLHKRKSFEHERELRAIVLRTPAVEDGANIPVDLDVLIEKIFVSPTAKKWFSELVESIVSRYNLNKEVVQSSLSEDPVY